MAQPNVPEVPVYETQMTVHVVATRRFMASYLHLNKVVFMDPECPYMDSTYFTTLTLHKNVNASVYTASC